jgi:hypothetical protein
MKISRLLLFGAMCGLTFMQVRTVRAQGTNVFRVRIDRVTAKAGDTVDVSVLYTLAAPNPHNIHGFVSRFTFDSTLIRVVDFITDGTASAGMGFTPNRTPPIAGLVALGNQEIDLTNPVLFKIRIAVNTRLSDTGWLRWDRSITPIDRAWGVDSTVEDDGWVKTPESRGHVDLATPGITLHGESDGYTPDSVTFSLPVIVSGIGAAKMQSAVLRFEYDTSRLAFLGVRQTGAEQISGTLRSRDIVSILIQSIGGTIAGGDTLAGLQFAALLGTDTMCTALRNMRLMPLNGDAFLGNSIYSYDSICLFGGWKNSSISREAKHHASLGIYPNPAECHVAFRGDGFDEMSRYRISVFDMTGVLVFRSVDKNADWNVAPGTPQGVYEVIFEDVTRAERSAERVVIGPQP